MDGRWIDSKLHVVRSHFAPLLNPRNGSWHDHMIHRCTNLEDISLLFPIDADTLHAGVSSYTRNRQMSNVVQVITRDSAPENSFRDPIAIPLFVITQFFTLLNFPIMWIQIVQAAKKLKSAVRFVHTATLPTTTAIYVSFAF